MANVTLESLIKAEPLSPHHFASQSSLIGHHGDRQENFKQEVKQESCQQTGLQQDLRSTAYECAGCNKIISDRYLLKAVDQFWHEDCLKCSCCNCRLHEQGHSLYQKENMLLCKTDYLRLYGACGYCSLCSQSIPASEFVMKAAGKVFHLECFKCQMCSCRFNLGDRFTLVEKLLCETCYHQSRSDYCVEGELTEAQLVAHNKQQILHSLVRHSNSQQQQATSTTNSRILDLLQSFNAQKKAT